MYQIDVKNKKMQKLQTLTFADLKVRERCDIQEWIDDNPAILAEDLLIIGKEVQLGGSNIRLDLLALDRSGNLVIIELKRDFSGKNIDWQAIKYASYCSAFTDEEIVNEYQKYLDTKKVGKNAREEISRFIENEVEDLNQGQRIILVSREFDSDVASAVLWLNEQGLDITCIKIDPFITDNEQLIVYPTKIIPLPEAEDYIKRKAIQKKENAVQQYKSDLISFDIPVYSDKELEEKLSEFLAISKPITERFVAFLEILLSENRKFDREEIKEKLFNLHKMGDDVQRAGSLLSNISQAITRKRNDFLRQIISFDRDGDYSGANKNNYCVNEKYRLLVEKVLSEIK